MNYKKLVALSLCGFISSTSLVVPVDIAMASPLYQHDNHNGLKMMVLDVMSGNIPLSEALEDNDLLPSFSPAIPIAVIPEQIKNTLNDTRQSIAMTMAKSSPKTVKKNVAKKAVKKQSFLSNFFSAFKRHPASDNKKENAEMTPISYGNFINDEIVLMPTVAEETHEALTKPTSKTDAKATKTSDEKSVETNDSTETKTVKATQKEVADTSTNATTSDVTPEPRTEKAIEKALTPSPFKTKTSNATSALNELKNLIGRLESDIKGHAGHSKAAPVVETSKTDTPVIPSTKTVEPTIQPVAPEPVAATKATVEENITTPSELITETTSAPEEAVQSNNEQPVQPKTIESNFTSKMIQPSNIMSGLSEKQQSIMADVLNISPDSVVFKKPAYDSTPEPIAAATPSIEEALAMQATGALDLAEPTSPAETTMYTVEKTAKTENFTGQDPIKLRSGISANINELDVTVGKAVVLNLSKPAARVSISNPDIANIVVISPTQVQLVGSTVGVANLLVWADNNAPDHSVIDIHVHRDVSVLTRQLKFVDVGIEIVPLAAEDSVILTGEAKNRESAQLAVELAHAFFRNATTGRTMGSQTPGSATPGADTQVINLIKVKGEPSTKVELVRNRLNDLDPNITLDIVPGPQGEEKVILTGKVRTSSIISKAINTASIFYGQPGIQVITGPGGNLPIAASNDAFQAGTFNTNISSNVLQGTVMTDASGNVVSLLEVAFKPQIRCKVQFIEISKNDLMTLGHTLQGIGGPYGFASLSGSQSPAPGRPISSVVTADSGAAFAASANQNTFGSARNALSYASGYSQTFLGGITQVLSINEQFSAALSLMQERQKARTLAEPILTMLSGEKGSFLAGGEIPIPAVSGTGSVDVSYREFGIRLNMIPTLLDNGKIHMVVAPEISSIDRANGVTTNVVSVPGFRTRRMQTTLEIQNGQSFVIAGLYNKEETRSISGTPWISKMPVIGSFFRNKWKNGSQNEMVVIITPEVLDDPDAQGGIASRF